MSELTKKPFDEKAYFKQYRERNKDKLRAYFHKYYQCNKEVITARSRKSWGNADKVVYQEKRKERESNWETARIETKRTVAARKAHNKILRKYNMNREDFERMLKIQEGKCAICREVPNHTLHIDHNHATREVRGLLCRRCNTGIGLLRDSTEFLLEAIKYLS